MMGKEALFQGSSLLSALPASLLCSTLHPKAGNCAGALPAWTGHDPVEAKALPKNCSLELSLAKLGFVCSLSHPKAAWKCSAGHSFSSELSRGQPAGMEGKEGVVQHSCSFQELILMPFWVT